MTRHVHICGFYYLVPGNWPEPRREYLPPLSLSAHAKIVSSTSRTTLTQTFVNPKSEAIPELRYAFPLYDGVSVVGFVCTINGDRVIRGVVKERAEARKTFKEAVDRGETAGLLEQLPQASDVFTTTVGNVPAGATLKVDITYLGELKHDAEVDGIRYTIPTRIAPRYGEYPGQLLSSSTVGKNDGIRIVVDVEMPNGSNIKNIQSPSHPISVTVGNTSAGAAQGQEMSLQKASATLALATAELGGDFVVQVVATNTGNPIAVLETHPTIPNHRALMATLVPKFNLPSSRPEIVFVCDRSGSMGGKKIVNLKTALHIFLKSLPVGVKFNICSFGSRHEFLFREGSKTYDAATLEQAIRYVDTFSADFGGTEIYRTLEEVFEKRYPDMDLEVFLFTDGEIWNQEQLFSSLNKRVAESNGAIRVFSLGIGRDVSHSLIEGVARAGNGFSQTVGEDENMNSKAVRMLKAALTPHIWDYSLEVQYEKAAPRQADDDFEIVEVEKVMDALNIVVEEPQKEDAGKKPMSFFDESVNPDAEMADASLDKSAGGKYSHVPPVPEPKLLQAPFVIPGLYPFSRTSVYLLLSPETVQKQPKSVILRGKSAHGPLELEIPVTVLSEEGETIHQLAARKAVQELEEGRGWIHHARDGDKLLKEKHAGRFADMVEREAVRLGVKYQVGGRWCSFVAVEANGEVSGPAAETSDRVAYDRSGEAEASIPFVGYAMKTFQSPLGLARTAAAGAGGFRAKKASTSASASWASAYGRHPAPVAATPPPPPMPAMREQSGSPAVLAFSTNAMYSPVTSRNAEKAFTREEVSAEFSPLEDVPASDKLNSIVALQTFSGSWVWQDGLMAMLGVDKDKALARPGGASDRLATALVLAYLELHLADKKDEWEMLAEKATDWLRGELANEGGVTLEMYLEEAKKLIQV
ncbi:hypothetical protein MFIFM68171_01686 [Madurella fahalii]|uniref:Uncharacterized protein n=1 Tax=Madurella fahalii TaxID=1157608 RepID=A0ABQ0G130_9PEZI